MRRFAVVGLSAAIFCGPAWAQTPPQQLPAMGGIGGPVQFGQQPAPKPLATTQPAPTPPAAPNDGPGFGRDAGPVAPPPARPVRQNYAEELTDFHVPPQDTLKTDVASPTPLSIPGAHVITTDLVQKTQGMQVLLIDVLKAPPHPTVPGAELWPGAGDGGTFDDTIQTEMWQALSAATHKTRTYPIVFLCEGARCWESYNAALRAAKMGFTQVMWYRGGLEAWHAAGLPMTGAGQQPAAKPQAPANGPGFDAP